jgi:hypothetical protein
MFLQNIDIHLWDCTVSQLRRAKFDESLLGKPRTLEMYPSSHGNNSGHLNAQVKYSYVTLRRHATRVGKCLEKPCRIQVTFMGTTE